MTLYNADGQIQTTSVSGATYTGLYAADGTLNIVTNDGVTGGYKGLHHPCGAYNAVIASAGAGYYAANGSVNVISGTAPSGFVLGVPTGGTSWVLPGASIDLDFANNRYFGVSSLSSVLTGSRSTNATDLLYSSPPGYAYNTYTPNTLAISPGVGLLIFGARSNLLLNSTSPATQTTGTLGAGSYTLWVNGTGSALVSAGTATITGAVTATNGTPNTFTVTVAGTVVVTVTGSLNAFQLESGTYPTSFVPTAGTTVLRNNDNTTLLSTALSLLQGSQGTVLAYTRRLGNTTPSTTNPRIVGKTGGGTTFFTWMDFEGAGVLTCYNGTTDLPTVNSTNLSNLNKGAMGWIAAGGRSISLNGGAVATDSAALAVSGTTPQIGTDAGSSWLDGALARLTLFNTKLPDVKIQTLTTGGGDFPYPTFPSTQLGDFSRSAPLGSYAGGSLADGTDPDSTNYVRVTFNGSNGWITAAPLSSPVDVRNGSVRIKWRPVTNMHATGGLSSFRMVLFNNNGSDPNASGSGQSPFMLQLSTSPNTSTPGRWQYCAIPINSFITTKGSGVDFSSIKCAQIGDPLRATAGAQMDIASIDFVPNPRSKAAVCVRFDDGYVSQYNVGKPLLDAIGAPCMLAIDAPSIVGGGSHMTPAQVATWLKGNAQWVNHLTFDQTTFDTANSTQRQLWFNGNRIAAQGYGQYRSSYDGAYFLNDNYTDQTAWLDFKASMRTAQNFLAGNAGNPPLYYGENFPFGDPYNIITLGLSADGGSGTGITTSLGYALDQVRASRGVLVVTIHDDLSDPNCVQAFNDMITYVTTTYPSQIEFSTVRNLLAPYNGDTLQE